jgi:chromosome partitioning protein
MRSIAISNPKGGAGKSTCTLLLSTYLAQHGAFVCVPDGAPNHANMNWKTKGRATLRFEVLGSLKESILVETLETAAPVEPATLKGTETS